MNALNIPRGQAKRGFACGVTMEAFSKLFMGAVLLPTCRDSMVTPLRLRAQTHSDEIVLVQSVKYINCTYLGLCLLYGPM